jgi:hypothetical protein
MHSPEEIVYLRKAERNGQFLFPREQNSSQRLAEPVGLKADGSSAQTLQD